MAIRAALETEVNGGDGDRDGLHTADARHGNDVTDVVERYGPLDLLVVNGNVERGRGLVNEALTRGLAAAATTQLETARPHVGGASPETVLLDLSVSEETGDSLDFLEEVAATRPVVVMTDHDEHVDPVEVARRGGRGFLPPSVMDAQAVESAIALRERLRAEGTKVLAIDDDRVVLASLGAVLGAAGLHVERCQEPALFWDTLERVRPDLVVLDVEMPKVSGLELCRALRGDARWEGLPVMVLTARTDQDTVVEVFGSGADDFVAKRLVGPELLARIADASSASGSSVRWRRRTR